MKIWPIAWVSFLWSTASLMVFAVYPIYLSEVLKINHTGIGIIEGIAIASAFISKVISGISSDWLRKRRPLIICGSLISVITKIMYAISTSWGIIFFTRFLDRFGKGIRSAPTDALIADTSNKSELNLAYSIRQTLYALGAVCGSLLSILIMAIWGINFTLTFVLATIPAILALYILCTLVKEKEGIEIPNNSIVKINWRIADLYKLPTIYWNILIMTGLLMIARFSETFMVLKAKEIGWEIKYLPFMIIIIDLFHASFAFLNKRLSAHIGREKLLILGFVLLILANLVFSTAADIPAIIIGIILNGIHLGLTQGVLRAMIAYYSPSNLFGTAFALFYLVSGFSIFIGNFFAGKLSDLYGLNATFIGGLIATSLATIYCYIIIVNYRPLSKIFN